MGQQLNKYHIADDGKVYRVNEDGSFTSVGNIEDIETKQSTLSAGETAERNYFSSSVISKNKAVLLYIFSILVSICSVALLLEGIGQGDTLCWCLSVLLSVGWLTVCYWTYYKKKVQLQKIFELSPFAVEYDKFCMPPDASLLSIGILGFGSSMVGNFRSCVIDGNNTVVRYHWEWLFIPIREIAAYRIIPGNGNEFYVIGEEEQSTDEIACVWLLHATYWPVIAIVFEILLLIIIFF